MAQSPDADTLYEVVCPHCGKTFQARLLSGGAPRYQGFKCPHCRLFVSYDRANGQEQAEPRPS